MLGDRPSRPARRAIAPGPARHWSRPRRLTRRDPLRRARCSRKSPTSRPRSPTSATTTMSALVPARNRAEQRALAHAGAGKQADALPDAEREQGVDGAHTGCERTVHRSSSEGGGRSARSTGTRTSPPGSGLPSAGRPSPSSTRPSRARPHPPRAPTRGLDRIVRTHAGQNAERDGDRFPFQEPDHFRGERLAPAPEDAPRRRFGPRERQPHAQAGDCPYAPLGLERRSLGEPGAQSVEVHGPRLAENPDKTPKSCPLPRGFDTLVE